MAPREAPKATPKVQRSATASATKSIGSKSRSSPAIPLRKSIVNKKPMEKIALSLKKNNAAEDAKRPRTRTAPTMATPKAKSKENNTVPMTSSVTKSAKKPLWKRRPMPAHSGVPVPEKMKQLFRKQLQDLNDSL